ncbi:GNAT family N-acetyltransferase [Halalkalibacter nanhaiisediminis]|uniref:Lysine N-acyltransferase MbtK n=1 Tax=Halalkalibacter nanhaiisediminis TaxID=688079 RepID=A0A562QBH8_9BACI|nr:GNAT family N-acetyltransferase [Halalkalibacter nanhaiisediminis]TWI54111.1 RimJ/RimL family protein N-acetyltransferase [Halalkalibacter nanhaiisediminis]
MKFFDDEAGYEFLFRQVKLEDDLERLHYWHHQDHVIPFWNQNFPLLKYREHLHMLLQDRHQTLYIGHVNGEPMSYWESYWAKDNIVANYYDVEDKDQGIHLLFGPKKFLGKGLALPLLRGMTAFLFQHEGTRKIVAEPDIRNEKMIHIFQKCGFEPEKEIDLPDKRALLMFCERRTFFRRWKHVQFIHQQHV